MGLNYACMRVFPGAGKAMVADGSVESQLNKIQANGAAVVTEATRHGMAAGRAGYTSPRTGGTSAVGSFSKANAARSPRKADVVPRQRMNE